MDYSTLKKLALSMGEEFKIIDDATLEAINIQRLITREKEYCSNLESLINSCDTEINSLENETSSTKFKLEEVINRGLLLKSSLESLKSSHSMVELLKGDLLKQLQLEVIRTSEQNLKFESTVKKYEGMWENYKEIYQKFPLVSDLHKMQSKLKLESIQLSIVEKKAKDCQNKVNKFASIQDKKEKLLLVNVAEKYLMREKKNKERDNLEERVRLKRESLELEKIQDPQSLSYESSSSLLKSEFENGKQGASDLLSVVMDNFLTELSKEANTLQIANILFDAEKSSSADLQHGSFLRYEGILNQGSTPVPKLLPLPAFDSPPRKIRSVGNLLSPPKKWTSECSYDENSKSMGSLIPAPASSDSSTSGIKEASSEPPSEETKITMEIVCLESDPSKCYIPETSDDNFVAENCQMEMGGEVPEDNEDILGASSESGGIENKNVRSEDQMDVESEQKEHASGSPSMDCKPVFSPNSPEFSYKPRDKPTKVIESSTSDVTSPYFSASSYLNFMDVPQKPLKSAQKEVTIKQRKKISDDNGKGNKEVIDLTDDNVLEDEGSMHNRSKMPKVDSNNENDYYVTVDQPDGVFTSPASIETSMEVDHTSVSNNKEANHSKTADKRNELMNEKSEAGTGLQQSMCQTQNEISSPLPSQSQDDLNISYGSPMDYSQMSYADSIDYQDTYQSYSPEASSIDESQPFDSSPVAEDLGRVNIFASHADQSSFSYGFSATHQPSSASSLFGSMSSGNNESKEKKQNEVFNFSFDTKTKTPSMFKLF